jgi:ADP-ribose pyrophosphatase
MWELPAGLIEPEDLIEAEPRLMGVCAAAARETEEELGFVIPASRFRVLGPGVYPAPGMTAERQYFVHVEVRDEIAAAPSLDGSPLEEQAAIALVSLERALAYCAEGSIPDSKTELALRRLQQEIR